MKSVAIFAKPEQQQVAAIGSELFDWLIQRNLDVYFGEMTAVQIDRKPKEILTNSIPGYIDLVIVLGGDGTILRVARLLKSHETPLMAVNLGGLGFLTSFGLDEMFRELQKILMGDYTFSTRSMLQAQQVHGDDVVREFTILNDVVIKKATLARIIRLEAWVDNEKITTYLGDGLIVSSPTGSTGYSMSAGGPIICPHMHALVLTPICPHTFTHRPIVLGPDQEVEVVLASSDSEVYLTLDGQEGFPMTFRERVKVRRAPVFTRLIQNPNTSYFQVLCHKLKWGQQ
jgi:NAD+ kinase